ncbi:MAG: nucleotidyltransferase domain-containing protein [Bacillota bacterium]
MRKTLSGIEEVLKEFRQRVEEIYKERLKGILLYGSHARGEGREGSDIDLLVVLDKLDDPLAERERLADLVCELSLKYGLVLSVLPVAEGVLKVSRKPLLLNIKREGVVI